MKRNITGGALLVAILALASCSTQKLASNTKAEDDVYFSEVKAGDQIEHPVEYRQDMVYNAPDDDYYYYDSYASRINRFNYYSPFNYYDDYYYGYTPYSSFYNYGWNGYAYGGYGLGFGLSYGYGSPYYYGYNPYGFGYGYGLGYGYGGYYPYSYLGVGYGGGYPYWGVYSAYNSTGRGRPYRGAGVVGNNNSNMVNRSVRSLGYSGAYPTTGYYPGRPVGTNSVGSRTNTTGYSGDRSGQSRPRPQRTDYPNYEPQSRPTTNSYPSNSGNNSGGGSSSSSGSRGGGRPSRP